MYTRVDSKTVLGVEHISSMEETENGCNVVMDSGKVYSLSKETGKQLVELVMSNNVSKTELDELMELLRK